MALTIGELNALITIDDRAVNPALRRAEQSLRQTAGRMGDDADRLGRDAGQQLGGGFVRGLDGRWRDMRGMLVDQVTAATLEAEGAARRGGQQVGDSLADGIADSGGEGAEQAGQTIGDRLKGSLKLAAAGAGLAIGTFLMDSFNQAIDQQQQTAIATAGLAKTPEEAQKYGQAAGVLFKKAIVGNFEEGLSSITSIAKSGLVPPDATVAQLATIGTKVSDLSTRYGEENGAIVKAAQKLLVTGLAGSAGEAFDLITQGFATSANSGEDFLDTLNEYSVQWKRVGLDGATAIGVIDQAIRAGARDSDQVADALGQFGEKAIAGGKTVDDAFKSIGLNADEVRAKLAQGGKSGQEALQMTTDALRGTKDETARLNAQTALFGDPGTVMGDALLAIDPAGAAASSGMDKAKGATQRLGDQMHDTAANRMAEFRNTIQQNVVEFLGNNVVPALSAAFGWMQEHQGEIKAGAAVITAVIVPALLVLGAKAMWAGIQMARAWVIGLGPIGWTALAIGGLVALVVFYWDEIKAATGAAWDWVASKVDGAKDDVIASAMWLAALPGMVGGWFGEMKDKAVAHALALAVWVGGLPGRLVAALASLAGSLAGSANTGWQSFRDASVKKALDLVVWVTGLPGRISKGIGSLSRLLYDKGVAVVQGLWSGIKSMGGWIMSQLTSWAKSVVPGPIAKALGIASPSKVTTAQGKWIAKGLVKGLTGSEKQVQGAADKLAGIVRQSLSGKKERAALKKINKAGNSLYFLAGWDKKVAGQLKTAKKKVADLKKERDKLSADVKKGILDSADITKQDTGGWPQTAETILAGLKQDTAAAQAFAANLATLRKKGVRADLIAQIAQAGVEGGASAAAALANANSGQIKQINSQQSALVNAAGQAGTTAGSAMYGAGIQAAQGLVRGLTSQQKWIDKTMLRIAKSMSASIRKALGIKSPSRVMALVGQYTAQGLIKGIEGERSAVNASMSSLVDTPASGSWDMASGSSRRSAATKVVLEIRADRNAESRYLMGQLQRSIRKTSGGDVQKALGQTAYVESARMIQR